MSSPYSIGMTENINLGGYKSMGSAGVKGISQVNRALESLGLANEGTTRAVRTLGGMMQITNGVLGLIAMWKAREGIIKARETALAASEVAANATNPVGWARIVAAGVVGAAAISALTYAVTRVMVGRFDLSTPLGRSAAITATNKAVMMNG